MCSKIYFYWQIKIFKEKKTSAQAIALFMKIQLQGVYKSGKPGKFLFLEKSKNFVLLDQKSRNFPGSNIKIIDWCLSEIWTVLLIW